MNMISNEELGKVYLESAEKLQPMAEKLMKEIVDLKEKGKSNMDVTSKEDALKEIKKMIRDARAIGNYLINYNTREELKF